MSDKCSLEYYGIRIELFLQPNKDKYIGHLDEQEPEFIEEEEEEEEEWWHEWLEEEKEEEEWWEEAEEELKLLERMKDGRGG